MKYDHPEIEFFISSIYWCIENHHNDFTRELSRTITELAHSYDIKNLNRNTEKLELTKKINELYENFEKIDIFSIVFIMNPYILMFKEKFTEKLNGDINSYKNSMEKLMTEYLST